MFDKVSTRRLSDSAARQLLDKIETGVSTTRSAVCALLALKKPLLSSGVPHE
jgi:hypothetical protein